MRNYFATDEEITEMSEKIRDIISLMFDEDDTETIMENISDNIETVYDMIQDMDGTEVYTLMESILM